MIWLWLLLAYLAGLFTPPLATLIHGFIAGTIWQWRELKKKQ